MQASKGTVPELQVFDWLIDRVAPAFTQTSIHYGDLTRLLGSENGCGHV